MKGDGKVYFVDAAHLLHPAVPSQGWIKRGTTDELKTHSGRDRLTVLGAYSPDDHRLISIEGVESCDADLVCQLLRNLRATNPGKRLLVVLDNAPYQRAKKVQALATQLHIRLLFVPPGQTVNGAAVTWADLGGLVNAPQLVLSQLTTALTQWDIAVVQEAIEGLTLRSRAYECVVD